MGGSTEIRKSLLSLSFWTTITVELYTRHDVWFKHNMLLHNAAFTPSPYCWTDRSIYDRSARPVGPTVVSNAKYVGLWIWEHIGPFIQPVVTSWQGCILLKRYNPAHVTVGRLSASTGYCKWGPPISHIKSTYQIHDAVKWRRIFSSDKCVKHIGLTISVWH